MAIIMDGNGRWATQRGLPRVAGHRVGGAAARRIVERALNTGLAFLTLYAFSADNWRRPPAEVQKIFRLLRAFLRLELERFRKRGVRLEAIGRRDRLPEIGRGCGHAVVVRMLIARTEEKGCAGERVGGVEA